MNNKQEKAGRIAMLAPYYGEWPEWLGFTFRSFSANPEIQLILVTDLESPPDLPANVSLYPCSQEDFANRIYEKLKIQVEIVHPFKLTDFKPSLGYIFTDLIEGYSYWGYVDLDLVMGDFGRMLPGNSIPDSDIFSPSVIFFPGHFMIFRNSEKTRNLFMKAVNWQKILSDAKCYCFDERLFKGGLDPGITPIPDFTRRRIAKHLLVARLRRNSAFSMAAGVYNHIRRTFQNLIAGGRDISGNRQACHDFNEVLTREIRTGNVRVHRTQAYLDDVMLMEAGINEARILWKEGRLYYDEREILYYHFQLAKWTGGIKFRPISRGEFVLEVSF